MSKNEATKAGPMSLKEMIASPKMQEQFQKALPAHLSPERFGRIAITALTRTPKLQECTPQSVMKCLLDLSALGLEPDGRRAYLIPYGKEATLLVSYMGLIELVRRSGDVTSIRAETVCENDEFDWENGKVRHKINWRESRGEVQAVYAEATLKSGEVQTAVMTKDEVEGIRNRSKAGQSGPWKTDWAEMAKKTAVRRLVKMLPISAEVMQQVAADDEHVGMRSVGGNKVAPKNNPFAGALDAPKNEEPEADEPGTVEVEPAEAPKKDLWDEESKD